MLDYNIYARFPVLYRDNVIFTTNNSIFKYNRRKESVECLLTTNDQIKHIKTYGDKLVFVSRFEGGPDLYMFDLITAQIERLTFKEEDSLKPLFFEDNKVIFISSEHTPTNHPAQSYELDLNTKEIMELSYHSIYSYSKNSDNDIFVQKDEYGYLSWKNYRGGTRGKIYKNGRQLLELPGQCVSPVVYKNRVYFIYEEDNDTNIFSVDVQGQNMTRHTNHSEFKLQGLSLQNNELVYTQIGEIYIFDIQNGTTKKVRLDMKILKPIKKQSLGVEYLTSIENNSEKLVCAVRGNIFEKNLYSGGLKQISDGLRFTHAGFIDGCVFGIKDGRDTALHIFEGDTLKKYELDSQKIEKAECSNSGWIAYSNHKGELSIIDKNGSKVLIAKSDRPIEAFEWSKDGEWLVYELPKENRTAIVLYSKETKNNIYVVNDMYHNSSPSFDLDQRFIVFLSTRNMEAKIEELKFDYKLEVNHNAYYIPLKAGYNMLSPWNQPKEYKKEFCLERLEQKITPINIKQKLDQIIALENQLLGITATGQKTFFSLKTLTEEFNSEEVGKIFITNDKKSIIEIKEEKIKIASASEKAEENSWKNVEITLCNHTSNTCAKQELYNIFDELTWYMEEFFWSQEKMQTFKEKIQKYKQFLPRINTEDELYELLKQVQGEMKTSHSYVFSPCSVSNKGYLGVTLQQNQKEVVIADFIESTTRKKAHPILSINSDIKTGDKIKSINKKKMSEATVDECLLKTKNSWISIVIENEAREKEFDLKTIDRQTYKKWLYEQWVNEQRKYVSKKNNNIAYLHIKDMGKEGFIDFFLNYANVYNKKAIIIDARYNSGGHISTLLLEQLVKKKTGIDKPRHFSEHSIPSYTTEGKYVLLINQNTASDGEIFAENFKQLRLGTIIGERTWGGIVGIWPRYHLVNNLLTTQPEFATIFFNSEKEIENYGVVPDIVVSNPMDTKITPEVDLQLNKAVELCNGF